MNKALISSLFAGFAAISFPSYATAAPGSTNAVYSLAGTNLSEVALAVVNGKPLTAQEVKDSVLVLSKVRSLSAGKSAPAPSGRRANMMAMRLAPQLVSSMMMEDELDRRGVKATAESDSALLSSYNKKFKTSAKSFDELAEKFGELGDAFKRQLARESRQKAFFESMEALAVSDEDVDSFLVSVSNKLNRTARINLRATNCLEKAWSELRAGAAWENVATNYTEDALLEPTLADNWKDWLSLDLGKIEPAELMIAVSKLKPGEYTRPIETDEGLIIAKLVSRDGDFCTLARILVRMGVPVEVPTKEQAFKKLRREKNVAFQNSFLKSLKKNSKIEYPFGRKFVFKIWDEEK